MRNLFSQITDSQSPVVGNLLSFKSSVSIHFILSSVLSNKLKRKIIFVTKLICPLQSRHLQQLLSMSAVIKLNDVLMVILDHRRCSRALVGQSSDTVLMIRSETDKKKKIRFKQT